MKHILTRYFGSLLLVLLLNVAAQAQFGGGGNLEERINKLEKISVETHELLRQLKESSTPPKQPPVNPTVSVLQLQYIPAVSAVNALSQVMYSEDLRLGFDEHSNRLLVSGSNELIKTVHSIIQEIDTAPAKETQQLGASHKESQQRSFMINVFWITDSRLDEDTKWAGELLPENLVETLDKLGFSKSYILAQGNTSVVLDGNMESMRFEIDNLPVPINDKLVSLCVQGEVIEFDSKLVKARISAYSRREQGGDFYNDSNIAGSIIAPLGHYLVFGTTNFSYNELVTVKETGAIQSKLRTRRGALVIQMLEAETFAP